VHTYITQNDIKKYHLTENDSEGIANFLNSIHDGAMGLVLKEKEDGSVKGSFRTTHDDIDVSAYAKALGGGGHKKAAGFSVEGPVEQALEQVLTLIKQTSKQTH